MVVGIVSKTRIRTIHAPSCACDDGDDDILGVPVQEEEEEQQIGVVRCLSKN